MGRDRARDSEKQVTERRTGGFSFLGLLIAILLFYYYYYYCYYHCYYFSGKKKKQLSYHTRGFSLLDGCEDGLWTFKDTAPGRLPPGACRMGASWRGAQGLEQRGAQVVGEARRDRGRRGGAGRAAPLFL